MTIRKKYHITKTESGWQRKLKNGERTFVNQEIISGVLKEIKFTKVPDSSIKKHKSNIKFQVESIY